jgi:hypothetical protein
MSRVSPGSSAKAGAKTKRGPDQYSGTWEWACDRRNAGWVAAAGDLWIPRGRVDAAYSAVASQLCRGATGLYKYTGHGTQAGVAGQATGGYLLGLSYAALAIELRSAGRDSRRAEQAGSRLAEKQADSGGRLHVNRSGSKCRHERTGRGWVTGG